MFGSKKYDGTLVRVTGQEWNEYDVRVSHDMLMAFDGGKQVEVYPRDAAHAYMSRYGIVYVVNAELPAVTVSADLATLEERIPFYALNQATQDSMRSYSTMLATASLIILLA